MKIINMRWSIRDVSRLFKMNCVVSRIDRKRCEFGIEE